MIENQPALAPPKRPLPFHVDLFCWQLAGGLVTLVLSAAVLYVPPAFRLPVWLATAPAVYFLGWWASNRFSRYRNRATAAFLAVSRETELHQSWATMTGLENMEPPATVVAFVDPDDDEPLTLA